jgi:hypothetical protein
MPFSVRKSLNHVLEDQIPPPLPFDPYIQLYPCKSPFRLFLVLHASQSFLVHDICAYHSFT